MIGDCNPHEPNYPQNKLRINWRDEIKHLNDAGVRIYAVQCQERSDSDKFYKALAQGTGGERVQLKDFGNVFDYLMAICYREAGAEFFDAYEKEIRSRDKVDTEVDRMLGTLRTDDDRLDDSTEKKTSAKSIIPTKAKTVGVRKVLKAKRTLKKKTVPEKMDTSDIPVDTSIRKEDKSCTEDDNDVLYSLARQKREDVRGKSFFLNDLPWSGWRTAIVNEEHGSGSDWKSRVRGKGLRRPTMFEGCTHRPAVWEIAVQDEAGEHRKIKPVYLHVTPGFQDSRSWESTILNKDFHKKCIDDVLENNQKILIRRAEVSPSCLLKLNFSSLADLRLSTSKYVSYSWSADHH